MTSEQIYELAEETLVAGEKASGERIYYHRKWIEAVAKTIAEALARIGP